MKKLINLFKSLLTIKSVHLSFDLASAKEKVKNQHKDLKPEDIYLA